MNSINASRWVPSAIRGPNPFSRHPPRDPASFWLLRLTSLDQQVKSHCWIAEDGYDNFRYWIERAIATFNNRRARSYETQLLIVPFL